MSTSAKDQSGKRLGVLGGTFDPVHLGHLAVADYVFSKLAFDQIVFIPAARPPHKPNLKTAPFSHRVAMLELALENRPEYTVSTMEKRRSGPSYSVDTLKELRRGLQKNDLMFFLIGMDAFTEIDTWKDFRSLPTLCDIVVIDRPDHPADILQNTISRLGSYEYSADGACWISRELTGRIIPLTMKPVPISSTKIREMLKSGGEIDNLVSFKVNRYIDSLSLYS